jgi:hypothetical protein
MADEIKQVSYYMGTLPDKVGEGARILKAFQEAGVSFLAVLGYRKTARSAEFVVVVDDQAPNLAPTGKKAGLVLGRKQKGFLLQGEDRPGAAAETLSKLAEARINVISYHGVCSGQGRYGALVAVEPGDVRKAAKALGITA